MDNQSHSIRSGPRSTAVRTSSPGHGGHQNYHGADLARTIDVPNYIEILEITHETPVHRRRFRMITSKPEMEAGQSVGLHSLFVAMTLLVIGGLVLFTLVATVLATFVCLWVKWLFNLLAEI